MIQQIINQEQFTSVQQAQAGLTRLFQKASDTSGFYRVMRNNSPLGVLIPNKIWLSLTEDLEALSSVSYRERIARARQEKTLIRASKIRESVK